MQDKPSGLSRGFTIFLGLVMLAAVASIAFLATTAQPRERFTEFYLLGPEGKADNYPRMVALNQPVVVTVGIVNHEHQAETYSISVSIGGTLVHELGPINLEDGQKWEGPVTFTPTELGADQRVEYLLVRGNSTTPYLTLGLVLDVRQRS